MLKFENTANVGDTIRAYDFRPMPDRPDTYVDGRVESKGSIFVEIEEGRKVYVCDGYTIHCHYDTDGVREGIKIHIPFEIGGPSEFDNRVEVI